MKLLMGINYKQIKKYESYLKTFQVQGLSQLFGKFLFFSGDLPDVSILI